jgi:hypothetical protein
LQDAGTQIATDLQGDALAEARRQVRQGAASTGPCLGLLKTSSVALSQIHQESSEREMVTGAGCCTWTSLGDKEEKRKIGDRRTPYGIPVFSGFVETEMRHPLFFLLPLGSVKE